MAAANTAIEEDEHAILFQESKDIQKNAHLEIEDEEWIELSAEEHENAKEGKVGSGLVDTVFRDVSSLQPSFWSLGFDLAESGWLTIAIGTSSSFCVSLVPRAFPPEALPAPESLSILQRLVLAVLRRAKNVAHSLRTEHFELARLRLSLAGVGLAIPSVTGTIILRETSGEEFSAASVAATADEADEAEDKEAHPGLFDRAKAAVESLFKHSEKEQDKDSVANASTVSIAGSDVGQRSESAPTPAPAPGTVLSNQTADDAGVEDLMQGRAHNVLAAADTDRAAAIIENSRARAEQVTSTLSALADTAQPGDQQSVSVNESVSVKESAEDVGEEKSTDGACDDGDKRGVEAVLAQVAEAGGEVVNSSKTFFGGKSRSVLQRIVADMRDLRTALAACGFELDTRAGNRSWLAVIVGTFIGIQISVTPTLQRQDIDISKKFPHLSLLQRTVLRTLRSCDKIAVNLALRKLVVRQMDFKLSGLGLAIPVANVTFTLSDMSDEEKHEYEINLAAAAAAAVVSLDDDKLDDQIAASGPLPGPSAEQAAAAGPGMVAAVVGAGAEAPAPAAATEVVAGPGKQEESKEHKSRFGFILDSLSEGAHAAKRLVVNASAASMRAIHATGSSAQSVMHAATTSVASLYHKIVPRRDDSATVDTVMAQAEAAQSHVRGLSLELNRPTWLTLCIGTSNGFSVSFRPVNTGPDTLTLPVLETETSGGNKMTELITKLMRSLHRSHTFASHARRRVLTVNSYDLNVAGVGLNIPSASASVTLDRDPTLPLA